MSIVDAELAGSLSAFVCFVSAGFSPCRPLSVPSCMLGQLAALFSRIDIFRHKHLGTIVRLFRQFVGTRIGIFAIAGFQCVWAGVLPVVEVILIVAKHFVRSQPAAGDLRVRAFLRYSWSVSGGRKPNSACTSSQSPAMVSSTRSAANARSMEDTDSMACRSSSSPTNPPFSSGSFCSKRSTLLRRYHRHTLGTELLHFATRSFQVLSRRPNVNAYVWTGRRATWIVAEWRLRRILAIASGISSMNQSLSSS